MAIWNYNEYFSSTDCKIRECTKMQLLDKLYNGLEKRVLLDHTRHISCEPDFSWSPDRELKFLTKNLNEYIYQTNFDSSFIPLIVTDDKVEFRYTFGKPLFNIEHGRFWFNEHRSSKMIETKDEHFNTIMMNPDIAVWEFYELVNLIEAKIRS